MTICIVQSSKMGDMVCTTPMFRAIKRAYPDARLIVMGNALNQELLAGNPHIDEYVVHPDTFAELRAVLRGRRVEWLICTSPNPGALLHALLAGVPHLVMPKIEGGYSPYATKTYRFLSHLAVRVPVRFGHYMPREYLHLLRPLGIHATDTKKELYASDAAHARASELLPDGPFYIGIAPGVGNGIKTWDPKHFVEVAKELLNERDIQVVLFGGPGDAAQCNAVSAALAGERVVNLCQKLSVDELKAAVARLDMFISVDTGPIYIAEAFEVPTVDIVGPMDEREQPPRGKFNRVVVPPGRLGPAIHIMNTSDVDHAEARRQAEAITSAMVVKEALGLLEDIRRS